MNKSSPYIVPLGDQALCIQYSQLIDVDLHQQVIKDYQKLVQHQPNFITDIIPAYCSIAVVYNFENVQKYTNTESILQFLSEWIKDCLQKIDTSFTEEKRLIKFQFVIMNLLL